jgi:hypothetical protein
MRLCIQTICLFTLVASWWLSQEALSQKANTQGFRHTKDKHQRVVAVEYYGTGGLRKAVVLLHKATTCGSLQEQKADGLGFEPVAGSIVDTNDLRQTSFHCAAASGAVDARNGPFDADLQAVIAAWPGLSNGAKAGIVGMVRAAGS